jgi:hypothetical protein
MENAEAGPLHRVKSVVTCPDSVRYFTRVTPVGTCGSRSSVGSARFDCLDGGRRNLGESGRVEHRKHVANPLTGSRHHVEQPADKHCGLSWSLTLEWSTIDDVIMLERLKNNFFTSLPKFD